MKEGIYKKDNIEAKMPQIYIFSLLVALRYSSVKIFLNIVKIKFLNSASIHINAISKQTATVKYQ